MTKRIEISQIKKAFPMEEHVLNANGYSRSKEMECLEPDLLRVVTVKFLGLILMKVFSGY
jgi:hypothetical protein